MQLNWEIPQNFENRPHRKYSHGGPLFLEKLMIQSYENSIQRSNLLGSKDVSCCFYCRGKISVLTNYHDALI